MHLTPYLILVFVGYAAFMLTLAGVWLRNVADDLRARAAKG